uniref:DNA-directed DNA polymerase n=1 Tax=Strigamia maritima TaxID=126957 RepID=T1IJI9_STRMM
MFSHQIKFEPSGFCYVVIDGRGESCGIPHDLQREKLVEKFIDCLLEEDRKIQTLYDISEPLRMTAMDELNFQSVTICHICKNPLGAEKVRDHLHVAPGIYLGAVHPSCNLACKNYHKIPVLAHNVSSFDNAIILQVIGKYKHLNLNCIPRSIDKYLAFTVNNLIFLDSLQFLNGSLEKLTLELKSQGACAFKLLTVNLYSQVCHCVLMFSPGFLVFLAFCVLFLSARSQLEFVRPNFECGGLEVSCLCVSPADWRHSQIIFVAPSHISTSFVFDSVDFAVYPRQTPYFWTFSPIFDFQVFRGISRIKIHEQLR